MGVSWKKRYQELDEEFGQYKKNHQVDDLGPYYFDPEFGWRWEERDGKMNVWNEHDEKQNLIKRCLES